MEDQEKPFNINEYLQIGLRQKWWIIIPFFAAVVISFAFYKNLPKIYKATTLILVQPQKIPESYVRSTVTGSVNDQLSTIGQEILSRTRLEKVIQSLNLYADLRNKAPMEDIVGKMKRSIEVDLQRASSSERAQNTFSLSYEGEDPRTVMLVANQLASMFIEEHLRAREQQAESTSFFLGKELSEVEKQLIR
jgi:uncharacterized protein involved in exopolysaccharide biosynthesis